MSTLHKVKAYFGMVPLDEYEDDYLDDDEDAVAVLLPDDLVLPGGVLEVMARTRARRGGSVLCAIEVPEDRISAYGVFDVEPLPDANNPNVMRLKGMVEKPEPQDAPSNLAAAGRYILDRKIFDALRRIKPGAGGELQLTDAIADEIEARAEAITEIGTQESGLPEARLQGERGRTTGQLRLFASHIRDGAYLDRRTDAALPDRQPAPRPELRMMQLPVGPVAVFGASNFPLAFSTAGGDTAAALAAGCPVVVKAHGSHPATSQLVFDVLAGLFYLGR